MGLLDVFKNRAGGSISWENDSDGDLLYKFTASGDEIKKLSHVIVKEGQACLFVNEGKIAENITDPGKYSVKSDNIRLFTLSEKIFRRFDGNNEDGIWFYRITDLLNRNWKIDKPVKYIDPVSGLSVALNASGVYSFRLSDPMSMILNIAKNHRVATDEDIEKIIADKFEQPVGDYLSHAGFSYKETEWHLTDIARIFAEKTAIVFADFGFRLIDFRITDFSVEEVISESSFAGDPIAGSEYMPVAETMYTSEAASHIKNTGTDEMVEKLHKLKSLLDAGLIDEADYNAKKEELLRNS